MIVEPRKLLRDPRYLLAFGFGSGLAPRAPGTFGTLAAIPVFLVLQALPVPAYVAVVCIAFAVGVYVCHHVATELNIKDPGAIVFDEFVGLWVGLFLLPEGWWWLVCGFVLFRAFDILKPWPVGFLDTSIKGGLGIMVDDVAAGLYTFACLQVAAMILTRL